MQRFVRTTDVLIDRNALDDTSDIDFSLEHSIKKKRILLFAHLLLSRITKQPDRYHDDHPEIDIQY